MKLPLRIGLGVTAIVMGVNLYAFSRMEHQQNALMEHALHDVARTLHHEIVMVRSWAAHHGGVYILKREGIVQNPFLEDDLAVTQNGDTLVLRNPAMITRELAALGAGDDLNFSFRITSLDPVNPENAPDEFERNALERLDAARGEAVSPMEVTGIEESASGPSFRYVAPLIAQQACMRCHAKQGYDVGDVRGGLSIRIPMQGVVTAQKQHSRRTAISYVVISGLIAALVYGLMQWMIVRPLRRLEGVAARIGAGDYTTPIEAGGQDEIGDLTLALTGMRDQIKEGTERQVESEKLFALGQVAAGIAHDIRNPLFAVRNNVDYLRRRSECSATESEVLDEMDDGLDRIDRIVGEINEFAKPHPPEFGRHRLEELVESCMLLLGKQLEQENLEFEVRFEEELPAIEMDRHRMEQALINLISNAARATREVAPGRIRIEGSREEDGIRLRVEDNGHGIREEILDKIFDPFFTRSPNGTGLGLTIVKRVILQHHGTIEVSSTPGEGSVFSIRLPLHHPRPNEA